VEPAFGAGQFDAEAIRSGNACSPEQIRGKDHIKASVDRLSVRMSLGDAV
jgi:hypothetical protein